MISSEKENMLDRAETVVAILESEINSLNNQIKRNKEAIARMEAEFAAMGNSFDRTGFFTADDEEMVEYLNKEYERNASGPKL